jgi:hypothetical protein
VTDWLQTALTAWSLLIALVALVYVVLNRATDTFLLGPVAVLFLGCLVQLVTGVVNLARHGDGVSGALFVGYLVGLVLIPPAATIWALGEQSRSGTAVLLVMGLLVPVMLIRLHTIWTAPGV